MTRIRTKNVSGAWRNGLAPLSAKGGTSGTAASDDFGLVAGAMSAVTLMSLLKGIIGQPHPPRYDDNDLLRAAQHWKYGMPSNHSYFVWFVAAFVYLLHATMGGASWSARLLPLRLPRALARDPSFPLSAALNIASSTSTAAAGLPPPPLHGCSRVVPCRRDQMRIFARVPGVPHDTAGRDRVGAGVVPGGRMVRAL